MSLERSKFRYSITIETHDRAVLFCLRGLCECAEPHPARDQALAGAGASVWASGDGRATFRFSEAKYRSAFLGDATRLLAGKWMRIGLRDDDPATS
jgi:hypothetical protein